jgi:hypothetical protein
MMNRLKGELVHTIFLPDWKVRVTEEGRERLRELMTPEVFPRTPKTVPPTTITLPDGTEAVLKERVHQAFYETLPTRVPGVYVRRAK